MKKYVGVLESSMDWQVLVEENGRQTVLNPALDILNMSPDGLAWGYPGSGPSQLALALVYDVLKDKEKARILFPFLASEFIYNLDKNSGFVVCENMLRVILQRISADQRVKRAESLQRLMDDDSN